MCYRIASVLTGEDEMKQWHGQQDECPIDADKLIDATYRNGSTQRAYAGDFRWRWMQDSYDVVAYSVVRQRKHSQDILDMLEEGRKNRQSFLEQTEIDMKALAENGFDANSGTYNANAYVQLDNNK